MKEHCIFCSSESHYLFRGQHLCERCFQTHTIVCQYCNERVWNENIRYDEGQAVCPDCVSEHFLTCSACGRIVHENEVCYLDDDDDYPYCQDCYNDRHQRHEIHDYYFKPDPIFYGYGPRYFGVELEIDNGGEVDSRAAQILNVANARGDFLYAKHDGSLNDGFELVSHPMSLEHHCHNMPWENILKKAVQLDYQSHQAGTCGLHIHVSRDAFGETEVEQDAVIARILYLFKKHWEELLKFSRRTQRQLDRWAARYGYKDQPRDILDHAKKGGGAGRYTCVNLTNEHTIEFRIFRGTLKLNTLIATLQLVDRICDVALFLSGEEVKAMSWTTFVSGCTQPELVQYLKERRLYINEPVETEVEL